MFKKEKNTPQPEGNAKGRSLDSFQIFPPGKKLVFIKHEMVGVDIGQGYIKVVQIDIKARPPIVRGLYVEEIPIDKRERGDLTELYIIKRLKSIIKKAKLKSSLAISFVSGPSVHVHSTTLPEMPENQIIDALKADVAKDLPFSVDESLIGFNIVGRTTGRHGQEMEIAAVFAHKEVVSRKIWLLEQSGLQSAGMTVLPFAYENILSTRLEEAPEHAVIITVGEETTGIDFFRNGTFMFTREVSASGKDINKALSGSVSLPDKNVDISLEEAEVIKREYGVVLDQTAHKDNPVLNQLVAKSRAVYEKMAMEIKRSLGYFMRMAKISSLDAVYICGGGANTKNIVTFFQQQMEIDIEPFPFQNYFKMSPRVNEEFNENPSIATFILPACGLALEEVNPKINLVPKFTRFLSKVASFKSVYNILIFTLYILAVFLFIKVKAQTANYETSLQDMNSNYEHISEQNKEVLKFQAFKAKVKRKKKVLDILVGRKPSWTGVLKDLSHIVPENVYLQDIYFEYESDIDEITVKISGEVFRDVKSVEYTVSQLSIDLKKSPYFKDVNLKDTSPRKGKIIFNIEANLVY